MVDKNPQKSLSLLEILAATAVAVVLLLGVYSAAIVSSRAGRSNQLHDIAKEAARTRLDTLVDSGFTLISGMVGTPTYFAVPNTPNDLPAAATTNMITLTKSEAGWTQAGRVTVANGPDPTILRVTVEVRWIDSNGSAARFELSTFVTDQA